MNSASLKQLQKASNKVHRSLSLTGEVSCLLKAVGSLLNSAERCEDVFDADQSVI